MFNKEAEVPEGWREDLLDSISMEDLVMPMKEKGKLTTRLKDIICSYFYLSGVDPNTHYSCSGYSRGIPQ